MRVMVLILALLAAFRTTAATGAVGPATLLADGWRQYTSRWTGLFPCSAAPLLPKHPATVRAEEMDCEWTSYRSSCLSFLARSLMRSGPSVFVPVTPL